MREAALIVFFFAKRPTGWMVLASSNTGFTEFLRALPGGIVLWKIKCPSSREEAGTVSVPFPLCFLKGLRKEPFVFFSRSHTEIHPCGIHGLPHVLQRQL